MVNMILNKDLSTRETVYVCHICCFVSYVIIGFIYNNNLLNKINFL